MCWGSFFLTQDCQPRTCVHVGEIMTALRTAVHDFKSKCWHDTNTKRDADATPQPPKKETKDSERKEKEAKLKGKVQR